MTSRKQRLLHYWTATGVIPRWQLFAVYALITAICIVGFARIGSVAHRADSAANQSQRLAKENKKLTLAIQQQRITAITDACNDQNDRHDKAVKTTLRILGHPAVPQEPPLTAAQQRAQKHVVLVWVNALVPKRNCTKAVEQATSP